MTSIKIALIMAGAVAVSSSASAQTIVPTIGVDFGSPSYRAYQRDTDLYMTRIQTTGPIAQRTYAPPPAWMSRARVLGAGYTQGGPVTYR
jgi:hypothetical protein